MSDKTSLGFGSRFKEIQTRLLGYIFSLTRDLNDTDDLDSPAVLDRKCHLAFSVVDLTSTEGGGACGPQCPGRRDDRHGSKEVTVEKHSRLSLRENGVSKTKTEMLLSRSERLLSHTDKNTGQEV